MDYFLSDNQLLFVNWLPENLVVISVIFFLAAYIKGVTGLGFSTCALPLLTLTVGLKAALPLLIVPSLASNAIVMVNAGYFRETLKRFWPLYLSAIPGVLLGLMLLQLIDSVTAGAILGAVLFIYSLASLNMPALTLPKHWENRCSPTIGIFTGIINGITGSQMMPILPYFMSLQLDRNRFVQAINISFSISTLVMFVGLSNYGMLTLETMLISVYSLIPVYFGVKYGTKKIKSISESKFRTFILKALLVLSIVLVINTIFAD